MRFIEKYIQVVRQAGLNTNKDAYFGGNVTVIGTLTAGQEVISAETITSNSANALTVGRQGVTNPAFNVDASTANVATGLNVKGAAAGGGLALSVITSGTNEGFKIDAAGNGIVSINTTSTSSGGVTMGNASSSGGRIFFDSDTHVRKVDAFAFNVGPNTVGSSNALIVDTSTGSLAAGITIKGAVSGGTTTIKANDSAADSNLAISAKGAGVLTLQSIVAVPAGGSAAASVLMSSTASLGVYFGSGVPTVSAAQGSLYVRTDGSSTSTRLYVNTNGTTGWTNVTTAT